MASATFVEFSTDSFIAVPISRTISFASSSISILLVCYANDCRLPIANCRFKTKLAIGNSAIGNAKLSWSYMLGTIGILTGGGDAPGLNAVIRAVVKTATCEYGMRVIGIEDGFEGLLGATRTRVLSSGDVRGLLPRGGTILGTRNRGNFVERVESGVKRDVESVYQEAITNMRVLGIDALVVLGGEGTLAIANEFHKRGVCVCGVPKTIDNDLACTELTFGFVTALDIATEALDRLHTTAESHDRVMILEVMGRHAGWIALHSGIAGGADVILIPEIPFSVQAVAEKVRARDISGSNFSIIVVAEGAQEIGHELDLSRQG